jgi:hypothetical protein
VNFAIATTIPRCARQALALLLLLVCSVSSAQDSSSPIEVIVSPTLASVPLDRSLLRAVFTMRVREWPDGSPVRVFVLPDDDPLSDRFYREQLGMYSYVLRNAWDRMVFTGTGLAPTVVQSEREMRERVRSTPGAIGYLRKRESSGLHAAPPASRIVLLANDPHG